MRSTRGRLFLVVSRSRDRSLIFSIKFRRTKFGSNPNSNARFADTHVPHGAAVARYFSRQMGRPRAWHGVYHRMISSGVARTLSASVDGVSRTITDCAPTETTT